MGSLQWVLGDAAEGAGSYRERIIRLGDTSPDAMREKARYVLNAMETRMGALGVGWPRVHSHCDFKKPLKFEDEVEIHILMSAKTSKTMSYQFRFRKDDTEVARGNVTVVCVRRNEAGVMKSARIPAEIADLFEVAPADKLADNI